MSTTLHPQESTSKLCHEYSTSWVIENIIKLQDKSIRARSFSPLPNSDVEFGFEIWYKKSGPAYDKTSHFKMEFNKISGVATVPHSMKMDITVTIHKLNDSLLRKYEHSNVSVDKMNSIIISNEISKDYNSQYRKLSSKQLIMKCTLVFYEHLVSPTDFFESMTSLKSLKEFACDFGSIYQPSLLTDIEFKIGDESLPAHKSILAAHSPVFQRMLCGDFSESKTNSISIIDSSPKVFNSFLKYLYSGEIEDKTWQAVKELYRVADKYDVRSLKIECSEVIVSFLSVDHACEILKMAYEYGDECLKQKAKSFAVRRILEIAPKDDWKTLVGKHPTIGYDVMKTFVPKIQFISPAESKIVLDYSIII